MFGGADSTAPPSGRARHRYRAPQQYYDANNLYGWVMSRSLPYGKLKWVKEKHDEKVLQDIGIFFFFFFRLLPLGVATASHPL